MAVNSYILPDYFVRYVEREMFYVYQSIFIVLLIGVSSVSAMNKMSLVRRAAEKVIELKLDKENALAQDIADRVDCVKGINYCNENLPEIYEVFVKKYILLKRTPDEEEYPGISKFNRESDQYLFSQVVNDPGSVVGLTFIGISPLVIVFGKKGYMQLWDTEKYTLLREIALDKPYYNVVSSRNGAYLAARNGTEIALWTAPNLVQYLILENNEPVDKVAFSPDGNYLAAASSFGKVTLWDVKNACVIKEYIHFVDQVNLRPGALRVTPTHIIAVAGTTIKRWCHESGKEEVFNFFQDYYDRCESSFVINDNTIILCMSANGMTEVSLSDGSTKTITLKKMFTIGGEKLEGGVNSIRNCCFSSDRSLLVLAEDDRNSLWRRSASNEYHYDYIDDYAGRSWFMYLAIRNDNLAYLTSELDGGLQLCTIAPIVNTIGLKKAQLVLEEKETLIENYLEGQ